MSMEPTNKPEIITRRPDRNFHSIADLNGFSAYGQNWVPDNPQDYDDILKLSYARAVFLRGSTIGGIVRGRRNREDGIDMNRFCENVILHETVVTGGDKYAVTIKGGCRNITIRDMVIVGSRGWEGVDIDLGNYSDTTMERTTGVILDNIRRLDGKPVRIRVGLADRPYIHNMDYDVLFWQSLMIKAYCWTKNLLVRWGVVGWKREADNG